jgi:tetratricopeptide (TPR) repeat protein
MRTWTGRAAGAVLLLAAASPAAAQFKNGSQTTLLTLPQVSPRAVVTERIGLTDVTIVYHRPQANGRTIFGDVIAYDRVWRAGANDNTMIEFADPVAIEGHALAAGRYGVHMIPGASEWTVIFSKNATSWGSFSYDPAEDALRVKVKPADCPFHEALTFEFTDLAPDAAVVSMAWERVRVPFRIGVDTKAITVASLRNELRHLPGFKGEAWLDAALYCLDNAVNYDEALRWVDHAIQLDQESFDSLDLKSQILDRLGRHEEAAALQARALRMATPQQMFGYGDRLLREKKMSDARTVFGRMTREHPEEWRNWYGLARVQVAEGDRAGAKKSLEEALAHAGQPGQKAGIRRLLERLAAGLDIG